MKHRLAAIGLAVGLVAGGAAGVALGVPGLSGAQDTTTTTPSTTSSGEQAPPERPVLKAWMREALAPLVADGTITQEQADAVIAALDAARPAHRGGPGGHFGPGGRHGAPRLDAAAGALGMSTEELVQALRDGSTIAEVAANRGVDVQAVIDAMVADLQEHLAEEVAEGDLTQAEADAILAGARERITARVNGEAPAGPFEGKWPGRRGPR
jgi:hypothetical protein